MSKKADDIIDVDTLKKLEELGLTEKESRVYIALLPRQGTGTSSLIRATHLHGQFVYAALARLEELGLAKHVVQNGRKKFSANPPTRLLALVEEKRLAAQSVAKELSARFAAPATQDFEVYQGRSAFVAHEFELLEQMPEGGVVEVMGSGGEKYIENMGHEVDTYERLRIAKKITVRYLSTGENRNYLRVMASTRQLFDYRVLPSPAPGVDVDILGDRVVLHLYGDPMVTFAFKNKEIAGGYRRFFEVLWGLSTR